MTRVNALWFCVLMACAQDGADGEDGDDGESVEFEQLASGSPPCPAGGVRLTIGRTDQVICNGERGAMGAIGAPGTAGAPGQAGQTGTQGVALVPQTITACVSSATLPASGTLADLFYKQVTFSDGSVFVSCSAVTTGLVSAGQADLLAGWQQGALTGACIVTSDASGSANGGWWEFRMIDGRPRAVYHDPGTADDLANFTFPLSDCPTAMRPN